MNNQKPLMGDSPTLEQWRDLYNIAIEIKQSAPWQNLWDSDLITLQLPGRDEPVYCSVMGRIGECFAVAIYPGYEAVLAYYKMREFSDNMPLHISMAIQNCLICYFGDREELSPKERGILKELGIKFRGRNQWIYFRSYKPGLYPWDIDSDQADLLIQALRNMLAAYSHMINEKIEVDFEGGETLLRCYSEEENQWLNDVIKMPPIPMKIYDYTLNDDMLPARLKAKKQTDAEIEIDVFHMPMPVQESEEHIPYLPRLAMLVDANSMMILDQKMLEYEDSTPDAMINMLADYISTFGRPSIIYVRDDDMGRYILDFCQRISVELVPEEGVPIIDELAEDLLKLMDGGM